MNTLNSLSKQSGAKHPQHVKSNNHPDIGDSLGQSLDIAS